MTTMGNDQGQGKGYGRVQPDIIGEWSAGLDKTRNRMELARTADQKPDQPLKIALRSTGDPDVVLTTTAAQVLTLAEGIREGRFDHVIRQQS